MKSNGASFVLPLTNAHAGREERYDNLREALSEARKGWVTVESDAEQDSWITTPQNSKKLQTMELKWFDGEFFKLIETAFRERF